MNLLPKITILFLQLSLAFASTCVDKSLGPGIPSDCPNRRELCNNPLYRTLMDDQCPLTFGRCRTAAISQTSQSSLPSANCADRLGPNGVSDCPKFPERCTDPLWGAFMQRECPLTCGRCSPTNTRPSPNLATPTVPEETQSLDQLYQAALAEGGRIVVYAGGDAPDQQDGIKQAFLARFPRMHFDVVVDYSKFHDARIDLQLASGQLIPDVAHLQTLQDFPRWKREDVLLQYKPRGWSQIYEEFRDPDVFYYGFGINLFSNVVNSQLLRNEEDWPRVATDYLKTRFSNRKLVITYPNDDDAVLFLFKQIIDKYGWKWLSQLMRQNPVMVRGTAVPFKRILDGSAVATMTTFAASTAQTTPGNLARFSFPTNNDPFVVWAQQGAIFKQARHPAAAKLYVNFLLDMARNVNGQSLWSVRKDGQLARGFRPIWEYPNSSHRKFLDFMQDREGVERFKTQIMLYIGEPQGPPAAGVLGPNPT